MKDHDLIRNIDEDLAISETTSEVAQSDDSVSSTNVPEKNSSSFTKAWIAGALVPSVLFLALVNAFLIWWRKRRHRGQETPDNHITNNVQRSLGFDKPELDSKDITRPSNKEDGATITHTTSPDNIVSGFYTEIPAIEVPRTNTLSSPMSGAEIEANEVTVHELPTKK
ncbi:hypothetical protein FBEOM_6593 [Fusarium beomiforme]|uniref:Uncharacterized protein n=1 Tax=Fusarium beomiforme TaxID=44412 RepID=A0A9P5AKE0_9HYPO|nr:hypothetical protein FBEOM_6593 [Fusarium beomiforme]